MSRKENGPMYPVRGAKISGDPPIKLQTTGFGGRYAPAVKNQKEKTKVSEVLKTTDNRAPVGSKGKEANGVHPNTYSSNTANTLTGGKPVETHFSNTSLKPALVKQANVDSAPAQSANKVSSGSDLSTFDVRAASERQYTGGHRQKRKSRRIFTSRRSAYKIRNRLGDRPADQLSEKEKSSLNWALEIIAQHEEFLKDGSGSKRQRSEEEKLPGNKRPRPQHLKPGRQLPRPFNEVAKDALILAVIDRNVGDGTISPANWKLVKSAIDRVYWEILEQNPGPVPQCSDAGWHQGHIKIIACKNERSAFLYKKAVESLGEIWQGARLETVSLDEVPNRPRSVARIPAEQTEPREILQCLQRSNPELPTHDWKVVKVGEMKGGSREATIIINDESIDPILKGRGVVYYLFHEITLRIYRSDIKGRAPLSERAHVAPERDKTTSGDDIASISSAEDTHSSSGMVGQFFGRMSVAGCEDEPLKSDSEDIDVTVIHVDDLKNGQNDEGNTD